MTFIQCTTLSGTIAFFSYLLCNHIFHLSPSSRYILLKLNLMFFLIPFSLFRSIFTKYMPDFFFKQHKYRFMQSAPFKRIYQTDTKTIQPFEVYPAAWKIFYIVMIFLLIFLFLFYLRKYCTTGKLIKNTAISIAYSEMFDTCKKELNIKKTVQLTELSLQCSPFTIGIFQPTIVLTKQMSNMDLYYILKHELYHIKILDTLWQLIARLAILFHFYNPFVYLFFYEFGKVCELHCDEKVLEMANPIQRKYYGNLLFKQACGNHDKFVFSSRAFSLQNKKILKERIIMCKKPVYFKKLFTLITATCICLSSAVPVFAYTPPTEVYLSNASDSFSDADDEVWFTTDTEILASTDEHHFSSTDEYFIDQNGNISSILNNHAQVQPRSCSHTFQTGQYKQHIKNNSGGCTVKVYSAKQCTKCGYIIKGSLISQTSYPQCPH